MAGERKPVRPRMRGQDTTGPTTSGSNRETLEPVVRRDTVTDALGVLMNLVSHANPDVRGPALTHLGLSEPPESLQETLEAARGCYWHLLGPMRESSGEELDRRLALNVFVGLAFSEQVPAALLEELVSVPETLVRMIVAERPDAPIDVQRTLGQDTSSEVRKSVADNPRTPTETLIELAGDGDPSVRSAVATNSNSPVEALVRLAGDADTSTRSDVAKSPKVAEDGRLALAVRLSAQYAGDPDGLKAAVDAVLE